MTGYKFHFRISFNQISKSQNLPAVTFAFSDINYEYVTMITGVGTGLIHHRSIHLKFRMNGHQTGTGTYFKLLYLKIQFFKQISTDSIPVTGIGIICASSCERSGYFLACQIGIVILISVKISLKQHCLFYPVCILTFSRSSGVTQPRRIPQVSSSQSDH